jgi:uncharacterized protein YceK
LAFTSTAFLREPETDPETGEAIKHSPGVVEKSLLTTAGTLFWLVDLPLSLVADTVYLPSDIRVQWKRLMGVTPPNPHADSVEKPKPPPATAKPEGVELPPAEWSNSLKTLSRNPFNSLQMSRRVDMSLHDPRSAVPEKGPDTPR